MSAQSIAKAAQGYQPKPAQNICGNCQAFDTTRVLPQWESRRNKEAIAAGLAPRYTVEKYGVETKLRCTLGNFAIRRAATCDQFAPKQA